MLSEADHERIAAAVSKAEAATSGEILCVLSHKVSEYREVPLAWGIGAALAIPAILLAMGLQPWLLSSQGGDWVATNAVALDAAIAIAMASYALVQIVIFAVVAVALSAIPKLRLALTPKGLKRRRVNRAAMHHLAATRLVGASSAVVIYASESERMVTVVADEAIHLKAGDAAWDQAVDAVLKGIKSGDAASGFVGAIEICGGYLADHFPTQGEKRNALSDGLIEL